MLDLVYFAGCHRFPPVAVLACLCGCSCGYLFRLCRLLSLEHHTHDRGHPFSPISWRSKISALDQHRVCGGRSALGAYSSRLALAGVSDTGDDSIAHIFAALSDYVAEGFLLFSTSRRGGIRAVCPWTFTDTGGLTMRCSEPGGSVAVAIVASRAPGR